ncbi:hypothetical protein AKAW_11179 [Aspergillus luchuensis IFO 4308]|nr:hypothetical protein AKAW_11179 [Aspergillus luchuensis IFO 4308]
MRSLTTSMFRKRSQIAGHPQGMALLSTAFFIIGQQTVPPSFPSFPGVQQVEETSLALPTESPMLPPPWDPLTTTAAEAHIADIRSRSLHQQPFVPMPIQNIESVVPPRLHNAMDFQETHVMPFVNVGANGQELSRDLTVPEDQVEHGRLT